MSYGLTPYDKKRYRDWQYQRVLYHSILIHHHLHIQDSSVRAIPSRSNMSNMVSNHTNLHTIHHTSRHIRNTMDRTMGHTNVRKDHTMMNNTKGRRTCSIHTSG